MIRLPETNIDKYLEHPDSGTEINNANADEFFTASWWDSIFGLFWAVCVLYLVFKLIQIQQQQRNPGNQYIGKFDFVFFTICFGVIPAIIAMMYTPNQINYYHFQQFFQNYVYLLVFVPQIIINFKQWVYCTAVPLYLIVIDYVIQICVATGDLIYPHFMQYVEVLSADGMGGFFSVFCMHFMQIKTSVFD